MKKGVVVSCFANGAKGLIKAEELQEGRTFLMFDYSKDDKNTCPKLSIGQHVKYEVQREMLMDTALNIQPINPHKR